MNDDNVPLQLRYQLQLLESSALNFGQRFATDSRARKTYIQTIKTASQEILDGFNNGKYSLAESAEKASGLRNEIIKITRQHSSDVGRAKAEQLKLKPKTLSVLEEEKASRLFSRKFSSLSELEKGKVWLEIVNSSGRNRASATQSARLFGHAGRTLIVLSLGLATYDVIKAKNKTKAVIYNGIVIGGSAGSGAAMGAAGGLICGPGAPLCVGVGVFIGGVLGALGTQFALNKTALRNY